MQPAYGLGGPQRLTPEQEARANIDRQLAAAGRLVQDNKAMNLGAGPAIARAFVGRLGPQDPKDEPASELLKRINDGGESAKAIPSPTTRKRAYGS